FSYVTTKEVLLRTGKPFETLKKFVNHDPTYEQEIQDFINERDQLLRSFINERDLSRSIYQYQRNIGQITQDERIFNDLYQQARSLNTYKASLNKKDQQLTHFSSLLNIPINLISSNETNELLNDIKNLRVQHNTLQVKIYNS